MGALARYYRHSGKFRVGDAAFLLGLGAIYSLFVGALYGLLVYYMPFIKLTFVITGAAGFVLAMGFGILGHVLKIRNIPLLGALAIACWFFAWYASWVTWSMAATAYAEWMVTPAAIMAYGAQLVEEGAWSLWRDDFPVRGYLLLGFWGAEGALLLVIMLYLGVANFSEFIFCERCNTWLEKDLTFAPREAVTDTAALIRGLEVGDYDRLLALAPRPGRARDFTQVVLRYCTGCDQSCYLSIKDVTEKPGKREVERKERSVVEGLWVPPELMATLQSRWPLQEGGDGG